MKFLIVLRKTEDWGKLNFEKFSSCKKHYTMRFPEWEKQYMNMVKRWEYLNLNYFQYRQKLKEMVMARWSVPWVDYEDALLMGQEDVILLPTDDDDCHHPDICNMITESFENPKVNLVWWKTCCHHVLHGTEEYKTEIEPWPGYVSSNGYAVRASAASRNGLGNHAVVRAETKGERVFLDEFLGYRTIHLAGIQRSKTMGVLYSLGSDIKRVAKPEKVEWAFGLMDEFYRLSNGLRWQVRVL
jgi:hypothetical protein